jgi:hypothetical protein
VKKISRNSLGSDQVKLPPTRPGLPGKVISFHIVPLAPYKVGPAGHVPANSLILKQMSPNRRHFIVLSPYFSLKIKALIEKIFINCFSVWKQDDMEKLAFLLDLFSTFELSYSIEPLYSWHS